MSVCWFQRVYTHTANSERSVISVHGKCFNAKVKRKLIRCLCVYCARLTRSNVKSDNFYHCSSQTLSLRFNANINNLFNIKCTHESYSLFRLMLISLVWQSSTVVALTLNIESWIAICIQWTAFICMFSPVHYIYNFFFLPSRNIFFDFVALFCAMVSCLWASENACFERPYSGATYIFYWLTTFNHTCIYIYICMTTFVVRQNVSQPFRKKKLA